MARFSVGGFQGRRTSERGSSPAGFWNYVRESLKVTNDRFVEQRKHRPDRLIFILILSLLLISVVVLWSIAPARAAVLGGENAEFNFIAKQIGMVALGIVLFFIASRMPLDFWRRWAGRFLIIAFALSFLLAIFGVMGLPIASCTNGACRWYDLPFGLSFQPAEFLKFGMMLFVAGFLALRIKRGEEGSVLRTVVPVVVMMLLALFVIVFLENDLGSGVALIGIVLCQLVIAKTSWKVIGALLALVVVIGLVAVVVAPHRIERMLSFGADCVVIDPESKDWHICQALTALGSGGFMGRGLGHSVQAFGWLPEAVNDSIFAILGETFGFLGVVAILVIFIALLYRIIKTADYIDNDFLRIAVAGVFGWIATHVAVNVGAMTGVIPLTGITLPFLSLGGSSLLFVMVASGIVYNVSRYTSHRKTNDKKGGADESFGGRRRLGRTRDAGSGGL
ncbi:MAG: FtsW/RodA/SpoVE family cell cycle protein [Candidatus Nomurabacteria bacterium]|jgi:cell division protein FtsW|nr:FtsW/RodA/SpoVE family cell cycle protein [Candidatus Nomurabacteria bacterium]